MTGCVIMAIGEGWLFHNGKIVNETDCENVKFNVWPALQCSVLE